MEGRAIAERFRSDSVPSSISNPKGSKMKLNEAIRGMEVKGWERRESSNGKCIGYSCAKSILYETSRCFYIKDG